MPRSLQPGEQGEHALSEDQSGELSPSHRTASPPSRSSSPRSRSSLRSQSSSRRRIAGTRQPGQGRVGSSSKSPARYLNDDDSKISLIRQNFSPGACSKDLALLTQRVAAAETQQSKFEEEAIALRYERDKLRAQLAESNLEITSFAAERGEMQARVMEAESQAASLRDTCNLLRAEVQNRIAEAVEAASEEATRRCKIDDRAKEDDLTRRLDEEATKRKEAENRCEQLSKERDSFWEQFSTEEQRRIQAESRAVAFEKEWDALRELLAAERLRHEEEAARHRAQRPEDWKLLSVDQTALEEALHTEEARRKEVETQLTMVKESLAATSERLASLEAAEVTNQVVEQVLLQRAGFTGEMSISGLSPGAGRIAILQCLLSERTHAEDAQKRIMALERRLGPDSVDFERRAKTLEEEVLDLERRLDAEEQSRKVLEARNAMYEQESSKRVETYRNDCFALHQKLEDELRWREEVQVRVSELEDNAREEMQAALSTKRAAHKQVESLQEDSLSLWGRLEAEQIQHSHDEARIAALERDARQRIGSFKEDCIVLESKVQAIEQAAQRQVENFSDDCLALEGRLAVEKNNCDEEESKAKALERLNEDRLEVFQQTCDEFNSEIECFEEAAARQMHSLSQDCLALRGSLQAEEALKEQEQLRVEALVLAAQQKSDAFHEEYMLVHHRLEVENARHGFLEQQLVHSERRSQEVVASYASLEHRLAASELEERHAMESVQKHIQQVECTESASRQTSTTLQTIREELEAMRSEHANLQARLAVEERRRATTDTHAQALRQQLMVAEGISEAAEDMSREMYIFQEECLVQKQRLLVEERNGDEAHKQISSLARQLQSQEHECQKANSVVSNLTIQLHRVEAGVDDYMQKHMEMFVARQVSQLSDEVNALQVQVLSDEEGRERRLFQEVALEQARRETQSAEIQARDALAFAENATEQAHRDTQEAKLKTRAALQEASEARKELESCAQHNLLQQGVLTSRKQSLQPQGTTSLHKLEADVERQKRLILDALATRSPKVMSTASGSPVDEHRNYEATSPKMVSESIQTEMKRTSACIQTEMKGVSACIQTDTTGGISLDIPDSTRKSLLALPLPSKSASARSVSFSLRRESDSSDMSIEV